MQEKQAAIEADLGPNTTIHRDQIGAYVQTNVLRQSMFDLFVRTGAKGRAYERFLAVLDREIRLATQLGLERGSKAAGPSTGAVIFGGRLMTDGTK